MKDKDQGRQDFLLKMYETAWSNINRTDETLWKLFFTYVTVVGGALFFSDKVLQDPWFGLLISLFITTVATCYSFNVNLWFLRNLVMIGNLEASFLDPGDYNKLIPQKWHSPYSGSFFNLKEFPTILGFSYPLFAILVIYLYWERCCVSQRVRLLFFAGGFLIVTLLYVCNLCNRFRELKEGAPGPKMD
jgi:hypothetical protein